MTIIDHIQYLITCHDCVVVAGFGAFVAQNVPARISSDGRMLLPPGRMLVFNNVISHDDGLLTGSVARREGMTYEQARAEIAREVELLQRRIDADGFVDIPRVGRLERSAGSALMFTPVADGSVADMSLRALPMVDVGFAAVEPEIQHSLEADLVRSHRGFAERLKPIARYAAVVTLLLAVGATLSTPVMIDDRNIDRASLSIPKISSAKKIVVPAVEAGTTENTEDNVFLQTEAVDMLVAAEPEVVSVADINVDDPESVYTCFVIVASCTSEREARRFIARQKDESGLRVIHSDGRYRVYAAASDDYDAAYAYKSTNSTFLSKYPTAWVYKRSN